MNTTRHAAKVIAGLAVIGALSAAGYVGAFLLRFAGELPPWATTVLASTLGLAIVLKTAAAWRFGVHRGWRRNVAFQDLVTIAKAVSCASIALTLADAMLVTWATIPRSVVLLDWGVTLMLLAGVRSLPRLVRDALGRLAIRENRTRVLIVGAGHAGEALLRALRTSPQLGYLPVGFVDQSAPRPGERIAGVPVLGALDDLAQLAQKHRIAEVLITAGELPGAWSAASSPKPRRANSASKRCPVTSSCSASTSRCNRAPWRSPTSCGGRWSSSTTSPFASGSAAAR